jgi:DNA helicase II / ATP-dependent DNA helicase PcrA
VPVPEPRWPDDYFELQEPPVDAALELPFAPVAPLEDPFGADEWATGIPEEPPSGLHLAGGDEKTTNNTYSRGTSGDDPPAHSLLDLNLEQLEAVEAPGPVMVVAPPGSGKTRTLAGRVCRVLQHASPQSVLAVTFTRYAAAQMRDQVRAVVGDAADEVNVSTLHALGYGVVRAEADHLGLRKDVGVALPAYAHTLVRRGAKAAGLDERWDVDSLAREIERAKGNLLGPDEYPVHPGDVYTQTVARVYRIYQETLREKNLVDFGDMTRLAVRALEKLPESRSFYQALYRHVLVDEWQDVSRAQYRLVRLLTGPETDLFVVGDPLQSIYGWRGADPAVFGSLGRDFPKLRELQLRVNYRNTEAIAAASEGVVRALGLPPRDVVAQGGAGDPLALVRCDTERDEALRVAEGIARLVGAGECGYNGCAVLVRTVRQARLIEQALLRAHVPYALAGYRSFFETRAVRELVAWLRLAADPFDEGALEAALNAPPRGLGKVTREQLQGGAFRLTMETLLVAPERDDLRERARQAVAEFLKMVDDVHAQRDEPPVQLLDTILKRTGYASWLRKAGNGNGNGNDGGDSHGRDPNGEVALDFLAGEEAGAVHNLRLMLEGYRGEDGLARFLRDIEEMQTQPDGMEGVFLGTIHAAKGLEWPVVFLPGLDEGILPHARSLLDKKRLEEEHRLFYVALTRAMRKVVLLGARYRTNARGDAWECRPSRFLGYLPPETVRRE